jgi:hypothetical protein
MINLLPSLRMMLSKRLPFLGLGQAVTFCLCCLKAFQERCPLTAPHGRRRSLPRSGASLPLDCRSKHQTGATARINSANRRLKTPPNQQRTHHVGSVCSLESSLAGARYRDFSPCNVLADPRESVCGK